MNTSSSATSNGSPIPVWYKIGAVFLLLVLAVLFFVFASSSMRHKLFDEVPSGGAVPGEQSPALPH